MSSSNHSSRPTKIHSVAVSLLAFPYYLCRYLDRIFRFIHVARPFTGVLAESGWKRSSLRFSSIPHNILNHIVETNARHKRSVSLQSTNVIFADIGNLWCRHNLHAKHKRVTAEETMSQRSSSFRSDWLQSTVEVVHPPDHLNLLYQKTVMGKSTTRKLWCIRILSGGAYLFKGGKKVESFLNIIGADEVTVNTSPAGTSSSVSWSSPTVKKLLKVVYVLLIKLNSFKVITRLTMVLLRLPNYIKSASSC